MSISYWIVCLRGQVRGLLFRAAMLLGKTTRRGGITIADVGDSQDADSRIARLQETLDFIEAHAPRYLAQWERRFDRILIVPGEAPRGTYYPEVRACGISARHLLDDTIVSVAMTLAHEAVHARLDVFGISYGDENRDRTEMLCTEAEIEMASKLPDADRELAMARAALVDKPWNYVDWHNRRDHVFSILRGG